MRNLEIKARDSEPSQSLGRALALGAEDRGELHQRDTYFSRARGRLKLREEHSVAARPAEPGAGARPPGEAHLIEYTRPDSAEARPSDYRLAPVSDPGALGDALDAAYGTLVVVVKHRRVLLWEGVRIHLDEVEGLGSYVELEALAEPGSGDLSAERDKVARLRAELRIEDADLVAESYSDLLLEVPEALLRAAERAMRHAHAPYSRFKVGAALRTPAGAVYAGANVENASYPQGQCAETSAIGALVAAGEREIAAVAVVAEQLELCPPCGGCRQRLAELARPDTPVYLGRPGAPPRTLTVAELLPLAFELNQPRVSS